MSGELRGKVALVTGATGGIGRAICAALAREGADVGVCYHRRAAEADAVAAAVTAAGCRAVTAAADVAVGAEVGRAVARLTEELGPADILVNNAGMTLGGRIEEITEEDWDRCLAVNLRSAFLFMRAVIPSMKARRSGAIVNITSVAAKVGGINAAACYSVSKAGLACLTIQAAKELLAHGVNVNAVSPGLIDTPMLDVYGPGKRQSAIAGAVRGAGRPEDVAEAVVFLSSPRAAYITGEILDVNGGLFMD